MKTEDGTSLSTCCHQSESPSKPNEGTETLGTFSPRRLRPDTPSPAAGESLRPVCAAVYVCAGVQEELQGSAHKAAQRIMG